MNYNLSGKTAIVTGASNGVGLSIAQLLCSAGANVVLADKNEVPLNEETELLKEKGFNVIAFAGDLTKKLTLNNLVATTIDEFETVEILVNGYRQIGLSDALNPEKDNFQKLFDQNFMVSFRLSQVVAKKMINQKSMEDNSRDIGSIINLSSVVGVKGNPGQSNYSASKAAIIGFTKSIALELGSRNIRCNAIAPGFIETEMTKALNDDQVNDWAENIPLKRTGQVDDIANTSLFLASDMSAYVTGQVINVCGGMLT